MKTREHATGGSGDRGSPTGAPAGGGLPLAAAAATGRRRVPAVDVARGVALVAMFVYHFAFDLAHFGFVAWNVAGGPLWRAFAIAIAGTFLFLAGASLVLAHGEQIRWRAFARRLALIAGAAALVTGATLLAMPAALVLFGILHAIALFSLLGLAFLRLPVPIVLAVAASVLALPFLWRSAAFDGPVFLWLGLAETVPPMVDYEPLFPWFAATLAGIAAARIALARGPSERWHAPLARRPTRLLARMGRNSLVLYLVHQPVFFALLLPLAWLVQPQATGAPMLDAFRSECVATCRSANPDVGFCEVVCACVASGILAQGLEERVHAAAAGEGVARMDPAIAEIARGCVARHGGVLGPPADGATADDEGEAPDGETPPVFR